MERGKVPATEGGRPPAPWLWIPNQIFATDQDLRILKSVVENFMDASFRSCPPDFAQYFTIHDTYMYKRKVIVLASVFMTRKYI